MSLRKNFQIDERMNFQLGMNAYNWLNHANYGAPYASTGFGPTNFGTVIFTQSPPTPPYGAFASAATYMRMVQVMAKLIRGGAPPQLAAKQEGDHSTPFQ
jgi:hypothetical protein